MEHAAFRDETSQVRHFLAAKEKRKEYDLYPEGSYVWLKDKAAEFIPGKVTVEFERHEGGGVVAVEQDGKVELRSVDSALAKSIIGMDDRYLLPQRFVHPLSYDLSLPALLHNSRKRFESDQDYFMIGADSLLYLNRFEDDDYRLEKITRAMMAKLEAEDEDDDEDDFVLPEPSVEQFAETAFEAMNASNGSESQSCVFFGSLQSGAAERNQDYIRKIVQLANPNDVTWWEKLLAGYVLLRAFGGTKFIPWTEMHFSFSGKSSDSESGSLVGAAFDTFLLDVSNLTNRNSLSFDCFYQLCGAAQVKHEQIEKQFEIHHKEVYAYLNEKPAPAEEPFTFKICKRAGCDRHGYALTNFCEFHSEELKKCLAEGCDNEEVGDGHCYEHGNKDPTNVLGAARTWAETLAAFDKLGVSDYESREVIQLLSDILRFGNVDILKHREFGTEPYEGRLVYGTAPLFGIELDFLVDEIAEREIRVGGDVIIKVRKAVEANALRDAVCKTLYTALFAWLTKIINRGVTYTYAARAAKQKAFRMFPGIRKAKERVGVIGTVCTQGLVFELEESRTHALEKLVNNYNQERLYELFADQELKSAVDYWVSGGVAVSIKAEVNPVFTLILNKKAVFESDLAKKGVKGKVDFSRRFGAQKKKHKLGILEILDDEMVRPGGSDKSLVAKIERIHDGNPSLLPAFKKDAFKVRHYGGAVTYDVAGFLNDTRSNVLPDAVFQSILEHTKDSFIVKLLTQHNPKQAQMYLDKLHNKQLQVVSRADSTKTFKSVPSGITRGRSGSTLSSSRRGGGMLQLFTLAPKRLLPGGVMRSKSSKKPKQIHSDNGPVAPIHRGSILTLETSPKNEIAESFHVGKFLQERSTIVQNNVSVLLEMLQNTNSRFVHCFESNRTGVFSDGFDSSWLLEQLETSGLGKLYSERLSSLSYGLGHSNREFLRDYWMLSPRKSGSAKTLCETLTRCGLLEGDSWRVGKNGRVFLLGSVVDMLNRVKLLAKNDMVVFAQKHVRGYLARVRYRSVVIAHITTELPVAIEESDLDSLQTLLGLAKKYEHRPADYTTALGKIERLKREKVMDAKLREAADARDSLKLYEYIQEAGRMGMAHSAAFQNALRVNGEIEVEKEKLLQAGRKDLKNAFEGVISELVEEHEFNRNFDVDEFISILKEKVVQEGLGKEDGDGEEDSNEEKLNDSKEDEEEQEEEEEEEEQEQAEEEAEEDDDVAEEVEESQKKTDETTGGRVQDALNLEAEKLKMLEASKIESEL